MIELGQTVIFVIAFWIGFQYGQRLAKRWEEKANARHEEEKRTEEL